MNKHLQSNNGQQGFPRLLVVTEFGPHALGGGGSLMRQLLRGYPVEQISWWSCRPEPVRQTGEFAVRHFHYPLPTKLYPYRRLGRLKSFLLEKLWLGPAATNLRKLVAALQPQQLWLNLHSWEIPIIERASLPGNVPCHVSLWDYPDVEVRQQFFGIARVNRWGRTVDSIFKRATSCDVISTPMREDMARRTGRHDAIVVHSGFEASDLETLAVARNPQPESIRIAYAGSIMAPSSLERFVGAFQNARRRLSVPAHLEFFGGGCHRANKWFDPECMREHEHVEEQQLYSELRRCTWGLVTMDLTDDAPRYNHFSFPNKFGTFVAAGLPLIVVSHEESSVARLMREYPVGVCTNAVTVPELTKFLDNALQRRNPRADFRDDLLRCGATEFNMPVMRGQLWHALGIRTAQTTETARHQV